MSEDLQRGNKRKDERPRKRRLKVVVIVWVLLALSFAVGLTALLSTPSSAKPTTAQSDHSGETASNADFSLDTSATPPAPKVYQGTGDDVVAIEKPSDGAAILAFECPSCSSNTIVKTNGAESLIVNTIGAYAGSHLIDARQGSNTTKVTVTATGAWKITVSSLDAAMQVQDQQVSGKGDVVLHLMGNTTQAALTNDGDANFVVETFPESGGSLDLPVNTIGSYKGTVPIAGPAYVQITSNGNWSVSPS